MLKKHGIVQSVRGSTCLFRALLARCLVHDKMALCRLTARSNMPPRLVALLPQREVRGDDGAVEQSPGFHVVFLPFAEDIRNLDKLLKNDEGWTKGTKYISSIFHEFACVGLGHTVKTWRPDGQKLR